VAYEVAVKDVAEQPIAVIHVARVAQQEIGKEFMAALDKVWPLLKEQGTPTGHNLAVYHRTWQDEGNLTFEASFGVQINGPFQAKDRVTVSGTPGGKVATVKHVGPYQGLHGAYQALDAWLAQNGHTSRGTWEVYGDWTPDESKLETDVYFLID
jgi:effector-binding domain-containing protein